MIILCILAYVKGIGLDNVGAISPSGELSLYTTITNQGESADYYFEFILDHSLLPNSILYIEFPEQYPLNLNLNYLECSLGLCKINARTISIILANGLASSTSYILTLFSIPNPQTSGGTGNFALSTYQGANLIDRNQVFGVLGISISPGNFKSGTVSIVSGGSQNAGDMAIYQFKFTLSRNLQAWDWLKFTFPANYTLAAFPSCSAYYVGTSFIQGELNCATTKNKVLLTGISQDLVAGNEYGIYIAAINPQFSGMSGTFKIETGRNSTFTVIDRKQSIEGVYINPGVIQDIYLKPYNPSWQITKNKLILYRLQFLLKNPLIQGSYIELTFSNSFNMDYTSISEIEYGLNDISRTQTASMSYSITTKILTISNFATFTPVLISLLLEVNNPSSSGATNSIIISSYLPDSTLVDQDTTSAYVTVTIYSSPTATSVTYPGPTGAQATGSATIISINLYPQVGIPQLGYVTISIPDGFGVIGVPTCDLQPANMLLQASPYCNFIDGLLTIQLYANTVGNTGNFIPTVENSIQIGNIIAPSNSGWYLFDFNTYSGVWDFLESGLATAIMIASQFSIYNFDIISAGINSPTILMISFSNSKIIPTGIIPYITTELQGAIEIILPTMDALGNLLFPLTLGIGAVVGDIIPCKGILGIENSLLCEVTYIPLTASSTENIIITIWNFAEISIGTSISIHIAGIFYVQSLFSPTITVTTYQTYNRVRSDLESASAVLSAGIATPAATSLGTSILLSPISVNSTSTLTTSAAMPISSPTVSGSPYLLILVSPTHEKGYCQYASPACSVNGITYSCTCYPQSDNILILLSNNIAAPYTWIITGLTNPESVSNIGDGLIAYLIDSYQIYNYYVFTTSFPLLSAGNIACPRVILSQRGMGYVNTEYIFEIIPQHYMLEGGTFTLSFGKEFTLSTSKPQSTCMTNYLQGTPICNISGNVISITGYFTNINIFLIYVIGVKNPLISMSSPFISISYSSSGNIIDINQNIAGIIFGNSWITQELKYASIQNMPTNANATAEYGVMITPSEYLAAGGIIQIIFPRAQFSKLRISSVCRLVGHVSTLQSCEINNNMIEIILDQTPPYKLMYIYVSGLLNFPKGSSDSFIINTIYDGVILQTNFIPIIATTTTQAPILSVTLLTFHPKNEGEKATYTFTFIPKYDILSTSLIKIVFPIEYDQRLGENLQCAIRGLIGVAQCSVFEAYTLVIYNYGNYIACAVCSITISIYGIINPTYHATNPLTGQFHIGIFSNSSYQELNEYAGNCYILPAGDYLDIENIKHQSLNSRMLGYMNFNITTRMTIPPTSDNGAIWITFPPEYPLITNNLHCTSSIFWALGVPDCNLYMDTIQANAQTEGYYGNLFINIQNLPYPLTEVEAGYITIKVYDGINFKLLARTYPNLSPNRLTFTYAGPLIVVNNDKTFPVTSGTMSTFIPITLDYPCALNLTLMPTASGFTILPALIYLETGDVYAEFRISVPSTITNGTYTIYWTTLGDIEPPYYVSIIPTTFNVVYDKILISVESPFPVPAGGKSIPIVIFFSSSPDIQLSVDLSLETALTGVSLSSNSIQFQDGQFSSNFTISVQSTCTAVRGTIFIKISGFNIDSFELPTASIDFVIFTDSAIPEVLSLELTGITRTTANLTVSANKVCMCYYAYALRGSDIPSFQEVFLQGPAPYSTTNTIYGSTRIMNYREGYIYLTSLTKQTQYTIYIWLQDLSGFISSNATVLEFNTDTRYKAAQVTLYYDQTYLTYSDIALAKSTIALLLSLADWRVIINTVTTKTEPNSEISPSSQTRRLNTIQSTASFYILDINNSENYSRPLDIITVLAGEESKLYDILIILIIQLKCKE